MNKHMVVFPTLKEIRDAHTWKRDYERYMPLSRYIYRPIGFLVTWVAVRIKISSETATYLSGFLGATGLLLLACKDARFVIGGIVLLHLFNLLDCVDGSIARAMNTENPYGKFLDSVIGDAVNFCFFPLVGVMTFRDPGLSFYGINDSIIDPAIWLIIGGGTAICYIFLHHVENIFDAQLRKSWDNLSGVDILDYGEKAGSKDTDKSRDQPKDLSHPLRLIDRNLRVRETHYFILIFAYWLCFTDIYLAFFLIYYSLRTLSAIVMFARRALLIKRQL